MKGKLNPNYSKGLTPEEKKTVLLLTQWVIIAEPMKYDFGPEFSVSRFDDEWIVEMDEGAYADGKGQSRDLRQATINACDTFMVSLSGYAGTDMYDSVKELRGQL